MLVRYEEIRNTDDILVIDECNRYLGECFLFDFVDAIDRDRDPIEENEYLYFFVDKEKLNLCFQSFSREII